MSQCGCQKPNLAHGRWWVGSTSRSKHNLDRSSLGFPSFRSRREPESWSSAVERENHAYGGFARPQREPGIAMRKQTDRRTQWHVVSAPICLFPHGYGRFSLWTRKTYLARAPLDVRRSCVGARGEATSSQNQVMTYPYYVKILKPSPPTIYHGQGLA